MSRKEKDSIDKDSLSKNYASDEEFAREVCSNLLHIFNNVSSSREEREDKWQRAFRAWSVDSTDADVGYEGRSNLNLPQIRKEVETMTRRLVKALFPPDYLSAESNDLANEELATVNAQVARHFADNVLKLKGKVTPWIKQGVLYGTSPVRQFWRRDVNEMFLREKDFVVGEGGVLVPKYKKSMRPVTIYDGPVLRAEDMFQTWVYPETAASSDEIEIVFWRTKINKEAMLAKQAEGTAVRLDEISGSSQSVEFDETLERMQQFGQTGTIHTINKDDEIYNLLECWLKLKLPGSDKSVPVVVEIINGHIATRIQRNPYWHQSCPIDFMRYILPPPGEFYGRGMPEASLSTQEQLNDVLNQSMDSVNLALNNITIINPAFAPNADSFEVEPGAIWWADPNAVKQMQFPDLSDVGLKNAAQLRAIISEMSDNSPQLPDPLSGKARSTGQAQLAFNEFQTDLLMFAQQITEEALQPQIEKMHSMLQQFLPDDSIIRIKGRYAGTWINRIVGPEDIVGRYNFKWNVSMNAENSSIKTQQMLNFIKVFQQIPPEAQAAIPINWENFISKVLRDGFQMLDIQNIIESKNINPSVPPAIEHKVLNLNGAIEVHKTDDHEAHIKGHEAFLNTIPEKEVYKRSVLAAHLDKHIKAYQLDQQAAALQARIMSLRAGGPEGSPQGNTPGNTGQTPESTEIGNLEKGVRG